MAGLTAYPAKPEGTQAFAIVTPGGGCKTHSPFPEDLQEITLSSISSAVFANYAEISNGLSYLTGARWSSYNVAEFPAPFRGAPWSGSTLLGPTPSLGRRFHSK